MRRKDLTLHHGLVRPDPVAAFGFTWSPEDADTDRWRIENFLESFVPKLKRVQMQDKQIKRRMERLAKAKTKARRWWLTRHIRADFKQRRRALNGLVNKYNLWRQGFFGKRIRKDAKILKLGRQILSLRAKGENLEYQAKMLMFKQGTIKRKPKPKQSRWV